MNSFMLLCLPTKCSYLSSTIVFLLRPNVFLLLFGFISVTTTFLAKCGTRIRASNVMIKCQLGRVWKYKLQVQVHDYLRIFTNERFIKRINFDATGFLIETDTVERLDGIFAGKQGLVIVASREWPQLDVSSILFRLTGQFYIKQTNIQILVSETVLWPNNPLWLTNTWAFSADDWAAFTDVRCVCVVRCWHCSE